MECLGSACELGEVVQIKEFSASAESGARKGEILGSGNKWT